MTDCLIVIPARLKATRLPGKPLVEIAGEPMIVHVWRRAVEADCGPVVVATDAEAVRDAVLLAGGKALITREDHASGSDRVFETVETFDPKGTFEVVVNLQGDLPTLDPRLVRSCLAALRDNDGDIGTIAAVITREEERTDPNVVKVVGTPLKGGQTVRGLYFTRATAPYGEGPLYTTSASMPIVGRLCIASCRCRHRRSSSARNSSSCEQSRRACASMSVSLTLSRSVSILRPTSNGRVSSFKSRR